MKYKRCCACDYFVTAADKRCPNCGIADPRSERSDRGGPELTPRADTLTMETPMGDGARAAFGGFIGAVIGGFLMNGMGVAVGVAVGVSLGVLLGADRDWAPAELPNIAKRVVECLRNDEETIRQRLNDISVREQRLEETRKQVAEQGSDSKWQKARQMIDSAGGILAKQRDSYHAKLWEIALVRWQNALEPLAADWESLTHETCNQRVRQLERLQEQGNRYLSDWEGVDLTELPEARRCLERLRKALETCDQLREALIVEQARLAVRGIAPVEDALNAAQSTSGAALHALDVFNARAALGEFETAFDELEAEYNRLKSEDELAEKAVMVQRIR